MSITYYPHFEYIFAEVFAEVTDKVLDFYKEHGCNKQYPILEDRDGNWHLVPENLSHFCTKHKLSRTTLRSLLSGKYKSRQGVYMGYRLVTQPLRLRQVKWDAL